MGERRSRFGFGRRAASDEGEPGASGETEEPCIPCGQQAAMQAFSLNPDDPPIDDAVVPSLVPEVAHAITDGEVVLFDPHRATSTLLNSSAALVWASIDGVASVADIVDDLTAETGADRSTIDADVRDTIARFINGGIVEPPPGPRAQDATVAADADSSPTDRELRRRGFVEHLLGRRTWTFTDERRCSGAAVTVRTDSDELAALLAPALRLLAPCEGSTETVSITDRGGSSARRFRVVRGSSTNAYARTAAEALDSTFTLLNDIAINATPSRLVLHAGAVERDGTIVVVAAPSGRGKSTLTAALVQRGFGYLSDEVVAIDPDTLDVLPYPKPFDLDRSSAELLGVEAPRDDGVKGKVAVESLGAISTRPGRVGLVVLLDDPVTPTPAPSSAAEHLIEILGNTFASTFAPGSAAPNPLEALAELIRVVPVIHLGRGSIDDACQAVDTHLRSIDLARTS